MNSAGKCSIPTPVSFICCTCLAMSIPCSGVCRRKRTATISDRTTAGHMPKEMQPSMIVDKCLAPDWQLWQKLHRTRKELGHEFVVKVFPTVEDYALQPKGLGQVFDCLCLASAGRPCGGAPQTHAEGPRQGHVAAVRHWGDHKAGLCTKVFVSIHKAGIHLLGAHVFTAAQQHRPWRRFDAKRNGLTRCGKS